MEKHYRTLEERTRGLDVLPVTYRDLAGQTQETMSNVQRWLGVDPLLLKPDPPMFKQRMVPRSTVILNYEELRQRVQRESIPSGCASFWRKIYPQFPFNMRLATVSYIGDEEDIIETFVRHHAACVDRMVIVCTARERKTPAILEQLRKEGLPLEISYHTPLFHDQAEVLTRVLHGIHTRLKPQWILPLDADEFLHGDAHAAFKLLPRDHVSLLPWRTYVPLPGTIGKKQIRCGVFVTVVKKKSRNCIKFSFHRP